MSSAVRYTGILIAIVTESLTSMNSCSVSWPFVLRDTVGITKLAISTAGGPRQKTGGMLVFPDGGGIQDVRQDRFPWIKVIICDNFQYGLDDNVL